MTNVDVSNQRRDILVGAGSVLFGPEWQRAIARTLGRWHPDGARPSIDDRLVRRWATGERAIPNWVFRALGSIFEAQRRELDTFLIRLRKVEREEPVGRVSEQDAAPYYLVHRFGPEHKPQFRKEPFLTELQAVMTACARLAAGDRGDFMVEDGEGKIVTDDLEIRRRSKATRGETDSTLKIMHIALPKEQLQRLTPDERSLFLLLGYASNQINTLWKLVIVAANEGATDPVEAKVSGAQTQIFVRLLIGIMREALKLIEKRFLGSKLGKEYVPRLSTEAAGAFDRLKRRFGAPDKFVVIRDNFAFHHPSLDDMEAAFQLAVKSDGDDTDWCMYLNNALLNTFFFVSDFVLVHGMANAMGETDVNEAHRKLLGDIAPIANDLSTFAFGFAEAIFIKYFGDLTAALVAEIKDAPNIEDLRLPWFVETTSFLPTDPTAERSG
jgi:hypothetical protein